MASVPHLRSFFIASLGALAACSASAQQQDDGLLVLQSGDFLRGSVQSLDKEGKLTWKHTLTGQEIRYDTKGIQKILFKRTISPNQASDVVWLNSNDRFVGRVESISETQLTVVSSFFNQPLRLNRSDIAGVTLRDSVSGNDTLVGGSMNAADWNVPGGRQNDSSKVAFKDGSLLINGTFWSPITRPADFPESFLIDTEIDWKDSLGMGFQIGGADNDDQGAKVNLTLELQDESIRLQRVMISEGGKRKSYSILATVREIDKFTNGARNLHLQVFVNTLSGNCSIYINKKFAGSSNGPLISDAISGTHTLGTGIQINQKSSSPLRIRSFAIKQWDGRSLPSQPNFRKTDSDHIYFEDGDNTKGKIIKLELIGDERILTAKIPYTEKSTVTIPSPFLDYFTFGNNTESKPDDQSTIAIHLTDGSILHLSELNSADQSILRGKLIGGYTIDIPSEAVAMLSFETNTTSPDEDN